SLTRAAGPMDVLSEDADLYYELGEKAEAERLYRAALAGGLSGDRRLSASLGLGEAIMWQNEGEDLASYKRGREEFRAAAAQQAASRDLAAFAQERACVGDWHVWIYGGRAEPDWASAMDHCARALRLHPSDL